MTTDEELIDKAYDLLDPLVRAEWTVYYILDIFDATGVFFDNGASVGFLKTEYRLTERCEQLMPVAVASMRRVQRMDGTYAWRLLDEENHTVFAVELAHPTDPLPVYVAALKEQLTGSRVQSVSVSDSGLCLHLDDDYDAVTNGAGRVRVDSTRVPFTVGNVFVNRGGGDFTLCLCAQPVTEDDNADRPVVAFKIDRDALDRKELSFNVI